jgi:hypothetical protein
MLLIVSFLCFICAVIGLAPKVNWVALGLAAYVLNQL